jgi:murein DD-endopeptidase MepM/ murein hydrolase activator NlpD
MTLRQQLLWTAIVAFAVGAGVDAFLRERVLLRHASTAVDVPLPAAEEPPTPIGTIGSDQRTADAAPSGRSRPGTDAAGAHALSLPIDGMDVERIKGGFSETRDAGGRPHAAADILAPRGTPVRAVDDGRIV